MGREKIPIAFMHHFVIHQSPITNYCGRHISEGVTWRHNDQEIKTRSETGLDRIEGIKFRNASLHWEDFFFEERAHAIVIVVV